MARKDLRKPILVTLGICALLLSVTIGFGQDVPIPDMPISCVHMTFTDTPDSMVITWRSSQVVKDAVLKAWPARLKEQPASGGGLITVQPVQHSFKSVRETVNVYDATLKGLEPNTAYNYVISCAGATSPVYQFQSPLTDPEAGFTFVVMGDSRGSYPLFGKFMRMAKEAGARFVLFTGDATEGCTQLEWNLWFGNAADSLPYLPLMPIHGNHELAGKAYFDNFVLPGAERYYSFDFGMTHFTVIYDNTKDYIMEQIPWIKEDLAASHAPWKFFVLHKPFYASSPDWNSADSAKDILLPIVEAGGVSMVFSGHVHLYERSVPMLNDRPTEGGIVHQVTGGAGAPLYLWGTSRTTAKAIATEHMIVYRINKTGMAATVLAPNGSVLDEYTVTPRK
ncbi:MAG: purple acid phosphatase family protein [Bacteroidota bacterium]